MTQITKQDAIKILIREGFLDKEGPLYRAYPDYRQALIMAIQALRGWDSATEEIERLKVPNVFQSKEWNEGFLCGVEAVENEVVRIKNFAVDHAIKDKIGP